VALSCRANDHSDYPRLLQFQLLVAQAHVTRDPGLSIAILTYIVAASNTKDGAYFNLQANTLLSNLCMLPCAVTQNIADRSIVIVGDVVAVPSVNIYSAKTVLKSRLTAAQAFEDAFRTYRTQSVNMKIQMINAANLLARNKDVIQAYQFQRDLKQKEFDLGVKANDEASSKLEASTKSLKKLGDDFEEGLKEWQRKKKEEAGKEIIKGFFTAALAIGATVASGGLAAPLAGMAAVNLGNAVTSVAKVIKALKEFYDKIKELIEKLKPVIDKIKALVKIVMKVIETLKKFNAATGDASTLRPDVKGQDPINATAEYDRFLVEVQSLESQMQEYNDINGKAAYFKALRILVINGKAAIQAQQNLVQRGDELAVTIIQQQVEVRDEKRLAAAATTVDQAQAVSELLSRAMFDRILAVRGRVYLDFFTFLTAFRYHTLREGKLVPELCISHRLTSWQTV
jgi:hypothetical protein